MGKRKHSIALKDNESINELGDVIQTPEVIEKKVCLEFDSCEATPLVKSEASDSISVTTSVESNDGWSGVVRPIQPIQQLRTSIRVQNKQKREESKDAPQPLELSSKKPDPCSQDEEEEENIGVSETPSSETGGEKKKRRRAWELWSMEDKDMFFEAINECGKDFEAIQNYLVAKLRKKDPSYVAKNKDQIRHFYYRTWHKISKHIKFSDDVKKATQELYALINYGELRRKVGGTMDEKKAQKLQELIEKGTSSMKIKGKSIRVKTPICRALKRLNEFQDDREQTGIRVPINITLEIVAATISSFWHVQGLAHNPRVRIKCSLHTPLVKMIQYLERKWKSSELKICERLAGTPAFPNALPNLNKPILHLRPAKDADIQVFDVQLDSFVSSSAVSLLSHEELLRKKGESGTLNFKSKPRKSLKQKKIANVIHKTFNLKANDSEEKSDSASSGLNTKDAEEGSDVELDDPLNSAPVGNISDDDITILSAYTPSRDRSPKIKQEPIEYSLPEDESLDPSVRVKEEGEPTHILHQLRALETVASSQRESDDADVIYIGEKTRLSAQIRDDPAGEKGQSDDPTGEKGQSDDPAGEKGESTPSKEKNSILTDGSNLESLLANVRKGWTSKTCGNITLGQLYLMFGKEKSLKLEFEFCSPDSNEINPEKPLCQPSSAVPPHPDELSTAKAEDGDLLSIHPESTINQSAQSTSNMSPERPSVLPTPLSTSSSAECVSQTKDSYPNDKLDVSPTDLSSMLIKLLRITRDIYSKSNSLDGCICGNNGFAKGLGSNVRSPASTRLSNTLGRSPTSSRSPRVKVNSRSPKVQSPGAFSKSPGHGKPKPERAKPLSAKKLLSDIPEEAVIPAIANNTVNTSFTHVSTEHVAEKKSNPIITTATSTVATPSPAETPLPEFRVPMAPAPRNTTQSQNILCAQLNKLRQSRPSRRPIFKNMVVQRQLPLLPHSTANSVAGIMNLKVLPHSTSIEGISFIANTVMSTPMSSNLVYKTNTSSSFAPQSLAKPITDEPPPVPLPQTCSSNISTNAISVNVSGQQLLTVEMPTLSSPQAAASTLPQTCSSLPIPTPQMVAMATSMPQLASGVSPCAPAQSSSSQLITTVASTSSSILKSTATCALPVITCEAAYSQAKPEKSSVSYINGLISDTLGGMSSLSSPPCTPKLEDRSILDTPLLFKGEPDTPSSESSMASAARLNMSSPPPHCGMENSSSMLNTPKHLLPGSCSSSFSAISPIKLNLSTLLSSISPTKPEATQMASLHPASPLPADLHLTIPGIQLPSNSDSLPVLDISMGGTVSIRESAGGGFVSGPTGEAPSEAFSATSATDLNLSVTCVTKNIVSDGVDKEGVAPEKTAPPPPNPFIDTSCDKLMDITLGNSNSNSNFSTLLSAAIQPPLDIAQESSNTLLQTPPKVSLSLSPGGHSKDVTAKANLTFGQEFPSLNASLSSPPSSPSRFLQQADQAWLQNEVSDFSLSSLLGSIESPVKSATSAVALQHGLPLLPGGVDQAKEDGGVGPHPPLGPLESHQRSHNLITMISDNSVDFITAFARMNAKAAKEK